MSTPQQNSKPVNPALLIIIGTLNFALVCWILWRTIAGLIAGKIHTMGRGVHELILQQDSPRLFWFWIAAHFFVVALGLAISALFFISCFKKFRQ
jgi:hypothetical protein